MMDFMDWTIKLQKLYDVYAKFDDEVKFEAKHMKGMTNPSSTYAKAEYTKDALVSSEQELCNIEAAIGNPIPPSLRETFLHFSKIIKFYAHLPLAIELPHSLGEIFSANFLISTNELICAEIQRKSWMESCFANPEDSYDKVWHNKLGFMTVPNGDIIAFDLSDTKEDKRVVYLSHDGGEGHGYVLGDSFSDYFSKLLLIGGCGNEDWQMLPFMSDNLSGINPDCDNARRYREIIRLFW
jgi:hypothetical protein